MKLLARLLAAILAALLITQPAAAQLLTTKVGPGSFGASGPTTFLGLVGSRQGVPFHINTNQAAIGDFGSIATQDMRNGIQVWLPNFSVKDSGQQWELGPGGSVTFACAILKTDFTKIGDCLFGGASTVVASDNTYVKSDTFNLSQTITAGTNFLIRVYASGGNTAVHFLDFGTSPAGFVSNATYGDKECVGTDAAITAKIGIVSAGGALTNANTGGTCVTTQVIPVLAVVGPTQADSSLGFGDSIEFGFDDTYKASLQHGIIFGGFNNTHPFLNTASGGLTAACARYNTTGTGDCNANGHAAYATNRLALMAEVDGNGHPVFNNLLTNIGTNDFHTLTTPAQTNLEANLTWIWGHAPAATRVIQTTITPKTSSSDNYLTVANQTQVDCSPSCATSTFTTFNNHVRAKSITGQGDFWDILQGADALHRIMNDPTTPDNKWAANGVTTNWCAADTVNHPSPTCYGFAILNIDLSKLKVG